MAGAEREQVTKSCIVQIIGMILNGVATVLAIAVCAMPHWKVSIVMENGSHGRRIDGHWISRWDGLWMTCVKQSNNPLSCQYYSQSLSMTPDLKGARVLMSFAVLFAVFAFINALTGILFNQCCRRNRWNQSCLLLTAGISFILAGILILVSVTWTASNVWKDVCFSSCKSVQQQELGEAIFLGWPTVLLFFMGGSIFCWYNPCVCRKKRVNHRIVVSRTELCNEESLMGRELRTYRQNRTSC
ncbi:claudin-8-like [Bombina bombina]|uniref:claudin-8-like n=1 Tax=Bombina bombina TaxID=8345 RepID=UPI00235A495C|nr:claudin-8-like [Bombina bombina]